MGTLDDAMASAEAGAAGMARGAAIGSIIPGIGTAIGAGVGGLAGVVMSMLPDADQATAAKVIATVQTIAGADPQAQAAAISDPQTQADLRTALGQIANDRQAQKDAAVEQARRAMIDLERDKSPLAWGAAIVSFVVVVGFAAMSSIVLFRAVPEGSMGIAQGIMETFKLLTVSVVSYWCGSSSGSARKSEMLNRRDAA